MNYHLKKKKKKFILKKEAVTFSKKYKANSCVNNEDLS